MKISRKLSIIVLLTVFEVSITILAALEISKGATFHQLNSLHFKYNAEFSNLVSNIQPESKIDVAKLRQAINKVRQQPVACLEQVNAFNEFIMKQIGTYFALQLCKKDIEDTDSALQSLEDYANGELSHKHLINKLTHASQQFNENSSKFEQPITDTVEFILRTMIPLIIAISLINIFLITYLSKTISGSIKNVIELLSTQDPDKNMVYENQIERSTSGELKELLIIAKEKIKRDILNTELNKELEEIVEERTFFLQKANDELTQFAYRASHDLKAPLSTSKGLSKYIFDDIESGNLEEAKKNSKKIFTQMEKLEQLVTDVLSLVKADLRSEEKNEINFSQLLIEIKERLVWLISQKTCAIKEELNISNIIFSEKTRLSQIIENLVSNSVKYMDPYKDEAFVNIKIFDNDKKLFVIIEDNGIGIPREKHADVFKMFQRFHPEASSGSGLGMSIVKKHVDYLGGQIDFQSSVNGTIFEIEFPIGSVRKV